jgi:glycosyltransferase involved in cell wall biosynthesis
LEDVVGDIEPVRPLVSVVIPVHNGMPFIKQALSSVLSETDVPLEVIVRENGSDDETLNWLRSISDERVRVVASPELVSAAENWTASCELARGEYIKLVCADDFICEGGLRRQYEAALEHPDAVLIASPRKVVTETGVTVLRRHGLRGIHGTHPGEWILQKVARSGGNPFGEAASVLFRSDALKQSLPFSSEFPYVTDLEMYVRVLHLGRFHGLRSIDAGFRLNNSSWSTEIGGRQLEQYRNWRRSRQLDGSLPRTRFDGVGAEIRMTLTFLARRVLTRIAAFSRTST